MIVLGLAYLTPSLGVHDSTTALLVDGKIRSAVSEDRFTGIKHDSGYPSLGIKYCLQQEGLSLSDVDKVVVGFGLLDEWKLDSTQRGFFSYAKHDLSFEEVTPIIRKNPLYYDHEYIHAKTGYFLSGFKNAVVISLDGGGIDVGQGVCGGIFVINDGKTEILRMWPPSASLGWIFGFFTELCGFRMVDGEGKTMSLAPYAETFPNEKKNEIYEKTKKIFPIYNGIDYVEGGIDKFNCKIENNSAFFKCEDPRLVDLSNSYDKKLIAWAAQKTLEETISSIVTNAVEITGMKNVVLTGGVFYNMICNMVVRLKLEEMNCKVFVNPICGDTGNAIGVVLEEYYQQTGKFSGFEWPNLSLGPEYDDKQILSALNRLNVKYSKVEKVSTASSFIDKGKIVGWFQGRTEMGPRGLGNRSILSRVDNVKYKDIINDHVKHREAWRPFCPTITKEKSDYYLENYTYAPYMIMGFKTKHSDEIPAVVHVDNTTRPQTIEKSYNDDFYNVVRTSGGILLNTSLNLAGDPINNSPHDALLTFKYSKMDVLIIGDYLVSR